MTAIGFVLSHEQFPVPRLIELGILSEQSGFDMVWGSDHFMPWMDNQGHSGHAWITLAALGRHLQRIPMGTGVTCPTYRYHPAIVAQAFASLANLYPGRIFLGVGSGEAINEKSTTGQWGDYAERAARLIEAIDLIRALWTGDWVTFQGRYFHVENAKLYDAPPQPIPIYVAAGGEQSMYLAGCYGDGLITGARSFNDPKMRYAFEKGLQDGGKTRDDVSIHAEAFVFVGRKEDAHQAAQLWRFIPKAWDEYVDNPDPRDILRRAEADVPLEKVMESWTIGEDPATHIEGIQKLIDSGVTHIYVHSAQEDQERVIDFYAQKVLPQVNHQVQVSVATQRG